MRKLRISILFICFLGALTEVCAQESTWREMPYFLKGYEKQYKKSPKEAALAWFKDAADDSWQSNKAKPAELNIPIQTLGWAYHSSPNQRQKSAKEVMDLLEYCAKVNANLLLNIGPRPDGTILEENVQVLREVGQKLKKEGFPRLNTKDYMKYRDSAKQKRPKEKENQTAN